MLSMDSYEDCPCVVPIKIFYIPTPLHTPSFQMHRKIENWQFVSYEAVCFSVCIVLHSIFSWKWGNSVLHRTGIRKNCHSLHLTKIEQSRKKSHQPSALLWLQGWRNQGGQWGGPLPEFADQLTPSQPGGGGDYTTHITNPPPPRFSEPPPSLGWWYISYYSQTWQ